MKSAFFISFVLFATLFCSAQKTEKLVVYFEFNKHALDAASKNKMDSMMKNVVINEVQINAHCDSIGSNAYNYVLSVKRAIEIKEYLVSKKLEEGLIHIKGSGKRVPLNKNETEEARAFNRRAEILFTIKEVEPVTKRETTHIDTDKVVVNAPSLKPVESTKPKAPPKPIEALNMDSVEVGSTFRLSNLNFAGGRHKLLPKSEKTLELLVDILKTNPNLKIEIDGYVCCTPGDADGLDWDTGTYNLSDNRARAVYAYLVKNGIDQRRLYAIGYGGSHKLVVEKTEEDRAINRRVEIKILKK